MTIKMTKKEIAEYKRAAKTACTENGIKVAMKNMVLLEIGKYHGMIDYVMFKDMVTGIEYQCYWGYKYYNPDKDTLWCVTVYEQ